MEGGKTKIGRFFWSYDEFWGIEVMSTERSVNMDAVDLGVAVGAVSFTAEQLLSTPTHYDYNMGWGSALQCNN